MDSGTGGVTVTGAGGARTEREVPLSWPDWLMDRVDALPGPRWLAIVALALAFAVVGHLIRWDDGTLPVGELSIVRLQEGSFGLLFLLAMRELDGVAIRALGRLRPVIEADDETVAHLGRRLTRTPWPAALVAGVVGSAAGLTSLLSQPAAYNLGPENSQLTWAVVVVMAPPRRRPGSPS